MISFQILYTIKITRKNNSKYKIKILLADNNKYIKIYTYLFEYRFE